MADLTLIYYTANRISPAFGKAVRAELRKANTAGYPVIAVSQSLGDVEDRLSDLDADVVLCQPYTLPSIWQVYRNILAAAELARTPYVACCEDDSLYTAEHFTYRPEPDVFAYNLHRWVITRRLADDGRSRHAFYYWRQRTQMAQCIAPRDLLVDTLRERFAKYPVPVAHDMAKRTGWGEPGRYEKNLGLARRSLSYFQTTLPNVTFNHGDSLMGRRQVKPDDVTRQDLEPWGDANDAWSRIYG